MINKFKADQLGTIAIIAAVLTLLIALIVWNANQSSFNTITGPEAMVKLEEDETIIVLDVRTEEEHQENHFANSVLIPLDELEDKVATEIPDKEARIFIYCRSGRRSEEAAEILVKMGYKEVYNVIGLLGEGMEEDN